MCVCHCASARVSTLTTHAHARAHRAGDFAVIVKTLQRYPSCDVDTLLRAASRLPPCESVLGGQL
jgi:hypothetical protein